MEGRRGRQHTRHFPVSTRLTCGPITITLCGGASTLVPSSSSLSSSLSEGGSWPAVADWPTAAQGGRRRPRGWRGGGRGAGDRQASERQQGNRSNRTLGPCCVSHTGSLSLQPGLVSVRPSCCCFCCCILGLLTVAALVPFGFLLWPWHRRSPTPSTPTFVLCFAFIPFTHRVLNRAWLVRKAG